MSDFKVGDRVTYTGRNSGYVSSTMIGWRGTVTGIENASIGVRWDSGENFGVFRENIASITPDVITINRADLPEVTESGGSLCCGGSDYFTDPEFGAAKHRQLALQQLAVADFIEARDKAAEEAIRKRDERRADLDCLSRTALIECIIELEASHD